MQQALAYFYNTVHLQNRMVLFKKLLYLFVLARCIQWLAQYPLLFGSEAIVTRQASVFTGVKDVVYLMFNNSFGIPAWTWLAAAMAMCVLTLLEWRVYFLSDFILWLLMLNLHQYNYASLTGADNLLNQFLFFNCFLLAKKDLLRPAPDLKVVFHNLAVWGLIMQICLVYLVSGIAKTADQNWISGDALTMISSVKHYSHPLISSNPLPLWLNRPLNYLVMFYQVLFPCLIWIKAIKKPLLLAGILMHIYIALVMGLVWFGLIMIIAYTCFWPTNGSDRK